MTNWLRHGRTLLIALSGLLYTVLLYKSILSPDNRQLSIVLALLPVLLFAVLLSWGSRLRYPVLAMLLFGGVGVWHFWHEPLIENYVWFYLLQHVSIYAGFAWLFGRTLLGGRTALVTHFAAIVHEDMPPEQVRYTRQVTMAWTLFFISVVILSILLFIMAPLKDWGFFANIATPVLMGLMFAGEYQVRLRRLPHIKHVNIVQSIRVSTRYFRENRQKARS